MVPGAVFLKGEVKGSSFGIIFLVFAWSDETRKNKMSQKWAPSIPKDAARLGDLGKRVFGPKFLKFDGDFFFVFRVAGFSRFSEIFQRKDESKALI